MLDSSHRMNLVGKIFDQSKLVLHHVKSKTSEVVNINCRYKYYCWKIEPPANRGTLLAVKLNLDWSIYYIIKRVANISTNLYKRKIMAPFILTIVVVHKWLSES